MTIGVEKESLPLEGKVRFVSVKMLLQKEFSPDMKAFMTELI